MGESVFARLQVEANSNCTLTGMNTSFLVVDNAFNREWNAELIGLRFEVAPSYTGVVASNVKADFFNFEEYRRGK